MANQISVKDPEKIKFNLNNQIGGSIEPSFEFEETAGEILKTSGQIATEVTSGIFEALVGLGEDIAGPGTIEAQKEAHSIGGKNEIMFNSKEEVGLRQARAVIEAQMHQTKQKIEEVRSAHEAIEEARVETSLYSNEQMAEEGDFNNKDYRGKGLRSIANRMYVFMKVAARKLVSVAEKVIPNPAKQEASALEGIFEGRQGSLGKGGPSANLSSSGGGAQ